MIEQIKPWNISKNKKETKRITETSTNIDLQFLHYSLL